MSLALISPSGDRRFVVPAGATLCVGREPTVELPILDPAVSRRHATLTLDVGADGPRLVVRDLGSRNGTWVSGEQLAPETDAYAELGDIVTFGAIEMIVVTADSTPVAGVAVPAPLDGAATMVAERPVALGVAGAAAFIGEHPDSQRLTRLIALATTLGALAEVDTLLDRVVADAFEAFPADRVAVLIAGTDAVLRVHTARERDGSALLTPVPRSLVQTVAERQAAWRVRDAVADATITGESVMHQSVRSALIAPLVGDDRRTLGVLYVDSVRNADAFDDADLDFLVAYAGIVTSAVQRELTGVRLRSAQRAQENLARYFTPDVAARIAATSGEVRAGGERRRVAVLFADIRGFTRIAEAMPPEALVAQLNEYFAAMVGCVFAEEGVLDKFIGDAVMAWWGAPVAREDDALRAWRTACAMHEALTVCNARWKAEGRPVLTIGVGVHVGEAFVGNIGAPNRLEYTLIGDTVNIASRLGDAAGGGEVFVSAELRHALGSALDVPLTERPDVVVPRTGSQGLRVFAARPGKASR